MKYTPKVAVWELTMACNMHCAHCGSSCGNKPLPGELTTKEALQLCDQIADLGLLLVTLTGGEPLLRKDWPQITKRLSERGVKVNMISNGWLLDEKNIDLALKSGLTNCAISIDGPEDIHNKIRCSGSFEKSVKALGIMKKRGLPSAVVTTVFSSNIDRLYEMIPILEKNGVNLWQFQIGLPMGNMKREDVIKPGQVEQLLNFIHSLLSESTINPCLSDCIGYNTKKYEELIKSYNGSHTIWTGCNAGKNLFGIFHDGSIVGCTSIRDKNLIEGNIKATPLKTIWTRSGAFSWNRDFSVDDLKGFCRKCVYAETCLGGCQNVKKTMTGDLSENPYCVHRTKIENINSKVELMFNPITLLKRGVKALELNLFETAEACFERADMIDSQNMKILRNLGFAHFKCREYEKSLGVNKRALEIEPEDSYSWKGLGNCLAKLGQPKEAENALRKSIELAEDNFMDPYYDLAVLFIENNDNEQAIEIILNGIEKNPDFKATSRELLAYCKAIEKE